MKNKTFITKKDQKKIKRYCEAKIKDSDLIKVKALAVTLEEKYCLHDILNYIREELMIPADKIWRGNNTNYVSTLPRGHVQIINDIFYERKYYHQYVVSKELGLDIEDVEKYIIHHIDENKGNNNIDNLFVFYDVSSHIAFHQALKHNKALDIREFNNEYIDAITSQSNTASISDYLKVIDAMNALPLENNNGRAF